MPFKHIFNTKYNQHSDQQNRINLEQNLNNTGFVHQSFANEGPSSSNHNQHFQQNIHKGSSIGDMENTSKNVNLDQMYLIDQNAKSMDNFKNAAINEVARQKLIIEEILQDSQGDNENQKELLEFLKNQKSNQHFNNYFTNFGNAAINQVPNYLYSPIHDNPSTQLVQNIPNNLQQNFQTQSPPDFGQTLFEIMNDDTQNNPQLIPSMTQNSHENMLKNRQNIFNTENASTLMNQNMGGMSANEEQ
uniref:Uncharacterized protein n=1 Tax=Meloidogyne javanica TaxID=6303 RepID=A0A915MM24_MELJA